MASFQLDPITESKVTIKLFKNVQNIPEIRQKLISGALPCSLVNPKYIVHPLQLVVAANKALVARNTTTKTIFTEILFNLSISKNITNSLKLFGVNEDNTDLLAVAMNDDAEAVFSQINGEEVDLKDIAEFCDLDEVNKIYKIGVDERNSCSTLDSVISRIATKDFVSH